MIHAARLARRFGRGAPAAVFTALVTLTLTSCNAFRSTEDCARSTDCPRGASCATEGGYCRTGGPIQIGAILPLTGTQAAAGRDRNEGLRFGLWILDRDPSLRILGRGLALTTLDTASTVENVPRLASELFERNIAALLGPLSSAEVLDAQALTFPRQLLHLAPGAGADVLGSAQGSLPERFLFQLSTSIPNGTIRAIPLFLADPKHPPAYDVCFDGMAVVVNDDATGKSYEAALGELLPKNCIPMTRSLRVPRDKKGDYGAEIAALLDAKASKPTQCLFLGVFPPVAGEVLRGLAASVPASRPRYTALLGASLLNNVAVFDELKSAVGGEPSFAEGLHGVDGDANPPRAAFRDLESLWANYTEGRPELAGTAIRTDHAFWAEAVLTIALAVELAGTLESGPRLRDAYIDVLQPGEDDVVVGPKEIGFAIQRIRDARKDGRQVTLDYRGAISDFDLDDTGFIDAPTFVWRSANGALERATGYTPAELVHAWDSPGPACKRAK